MRQAIEREFSETGMRMVKFGDVVKNANIVDRNPNANGIEIIVGL
jgi:type I restriction enzyme, S subunit